MYGALHPKSDIDQLYLKQKHGKDVWLALKCKVGGEEFGFVCVRIEWNASQRCKKNWYCQNWKSYGKKDFKKNS